MPALAAAIATAGGIGADPLRPPWVPEGDVLLHLDHENSRYWMPGVGVVEAWTDLPGATGDIDQPGVDTALMDITASGANIDLSNGLTGVWRGIAKLPAAARFWEVAQGSNVGGTLLGTFAATAGTGRLVCRTGENSSQMSMDTGSSVDDRDMAVATSFGSAGRVIGADTGQSLSEALTFSTSVQDVLSLLAQSNDNSPMTGATLKTFTIYGSERTAAECVTLAQEAMT